MDEFIRDTNNHDYRMAEIKAKERREKRGWWGQILVGLALLLAALGVIGVIGWCWYSAIASDRENKRELNQVTEACVASGGTWVNLNGRDTCLHMEVN